MWQIGFSIVVNVLQLRLYIPLQISLQKSEFMFYSTHLKLLFVLNKLAIILNEIALIKKILFCVMIPPQIVITSHHLDRLFLFADGYLLFYFLVIYLPELALAFATQRN